MILAILQARMSSTRLPGKVLMPILREPMIVRQIERISRSRRIDRLVVATSDQPGDDVLEAAMRREGIAVHRGPLDNVLERFIGALDAHPAEQVVRLTADCPLTDPGLIDATIDLHLATGADYASNSPDGAAHAKGLDVEVITAAALRRVAAEADSQEAREHVTWDVWNQPLRWKIAWLNAPPGESEIRWTVDRPDDYAFVATVYDHLYPNNRNFTSDDIRAFVANRPDLAMYGGDRRG